VVARFLALLELFREGAVAFEQVDPLGELHIRWTGSDEGEVEVEDEFDDQPGEPREPGEPADDVPQETATDV
jgi:segregation and condensation protein A